MHAQLLRHLQIFAPMDCSPSGCSVHRIFQTRTLEWDAISSSRGSSQPKDWTRISCGFCIGRQNIYCWPIWEAPQRRYVDTNGQQVHEKMLITNHQGNANQNHNEILPHACQNSYYQNDNRWALARMWWKGNSGAQLVGMYIGTALRETCMEVLKKLKIELPYHPAIQLLGIYPKEMKSLSWRDSCTSMFTAALFTIARHISNLSLLTDQQIKKMWDTYICTHTHTNITQPWKKGDTAICNNMDRSWGYCAKWNKPHRERQTLYDNTYMWNLFLKSQIQRNRMVVARG